MLLHDDDPRAAILLAWLATRDLLDASAVPGAELGVREIRTPAEAQPWIRKWDGLTADIAKERAAAFLEEFHGAPLFAVLRRTCRHERPALASIDDARFDAIARAIDRAFRAAERRLRRPAERALTLDPPPLGPLTISPQLASVLARAREARGVTPTLRQSAIASAEKTLGAVLPDEVLAYLAALGAELAHVPETMREAREYETATWGRAPAEELGLIVFELQSAAPFFAAAYRRRTSTRTSLDFCVYDLHHALVVDGAELTSLASYVRWRYDARTAEDELAIDFDAPSPEAPFVATVIGDEPAPREARIRHPKLGAGRVLERIGDKLVIAFDDGTQRTLLARFCEEE